MDYAEKTQKCHEYVEALEEERRKIQVFQRELPLCLELVTQAIEACKRELSGTTTEYMHGQSECNSEQTTSSDGTGTLTRTRPLLEEFMPMKRINSSSHNDNEKDQDNDNDEEEEDDDDDDDDQDSDDETNKCIKSDQRKKSEWLRSVQLWNQPSPSDSQPLKEDLPRKAAVTEVKRNGGAFQPFHKDKSEKTTSISKTPSSVPAPATSSSTADTGTEATGGGGGNTKKEDKDGQAQRKQRRCWSPELHRRFLHALQQLGGSHAATPKQIRELMKVDGLTNDEVKSHLQKYRLHTRRPSHTIHNNSSNPHAPQFVVVGGIWVPPQEYAAVAATTASGETPTVATNNGIYAPVAALPNHQKQHTQSEHMQSEGRGSHSEGRGTVRSNSPSTSSSTHTTTNSPLF